MVQALLTPDRGIQVGVANLRACERSGTIAVPGGLRLDQGRPARQPPSTFEALRDLIERRKVCLSRRLRDAAIYLVANPDEVAFEPLVTIGKRAGVSPSCIVRLSQRLGFEGFSEMQMLFQRRLMPGQVRSPSHASPTVDILHDLAQATERSIRRLDGETSREMLNRAVLALSKAGTTYVIGHGPSAGLARFAAQTFMSAGIGTVAVDCSDAATKPMDPAKAGDVCLILDLDAQSEAVTASIKNFRDRAVSTILVTNRRLGPAARSGLIYFDVEDRDRPDLPSAFSMCLIQALARMVKHRQVTDAATPIARAAGARS